MTQSSPRPNRAAPGHSRHAAALLLAGGALLYGCAVGPKYHPPTFPANAFPARFDGSLATPPTSATTQPSAAGGRALADLSVWWKSLNDPELNALVDRTVAANYDLKIVVARLQQAREVEYAVGGGVLPGIGGAQPGIDIVAAAGRSSSNNIGRGRISGPVYSGSQTKGLKEITQIAGFDAGWEFDLFGQYGHMIEAASADAQAAYEYRNDVLISVVADVVRAYVDVRSLQFRLEVARENAASQRRTADLVTVRFRRGLTNDLDVVLAERQLAATQSRIAPLEAAIAAAQRRVAVLSGMYPDALRKELSAARPLPAIPPRVAPGMPVTLLRRRPDIRQAERRLAAATARVGVATANLFPRVALTAGAGFDGQGLGQTPQVNNMIWSIGPTLYWPFLDFGQMDALVKIADYQTQQMYWTYMRTVVSAVQEVDDALTNYAAQQDSLAQLNSAVASSRAAVRLATGRYENGLTDFLNVLDAQRQLFDLEDQYAVAQQSVIYEFIAVYKALGGGWEGYEAPPPAAKPRPAVLAAGAEAFGKRDITPEHARVNH